MKNIHLSKVFRENRILCSFMSLIIIIVSIFWIAPTLKLFYWHFTHSNIDSLSLQIQTMAILSVVAYPACSFLLCTFISLRRPLKSQDEGGLLSDTIDLVRAGCIWFLVCFMFFGLSSILTGNFKLNSDYLAHFIGAMNIMLFVGTAAGIGMLSYSLSREFNPNKLPIEKLGSLST